VSGGGGGATNEPAVRYNLRSQGNVNIVVTQAGQDVDEQQPMEF